MKYQKNVWVHFSANTIPTGIFMRLNDTRINNKWNIGDTCKKKRPNSLNSHWSSFGIRIERFVNFILFLILIIFTHHSTTDSLIPFHNKFMIVHNFQGRSIDKLEHYLRLKEKTISFPRFDSDYRLQVPGKLSIIISFFLFDININCLHESVIVLRKRNG